MKQIIICMVSLVLGILPLSAQKNSASLKGQVIDKESGSPLISVRIYFPTLKRAAATDENGNYHFEKLPLIKTIVEVTYPGHKTYTTNIDLKTTHVKNFKLDENSASLDEVTVTGISGRVRLDKASTSISYISQEKLKTTSSTNIIDALSHEPGVSQITTGSGISKPVVRGLGYNRVVVVNNGVRQEGQQWGDEHGVEIDPNSVYSAEILKGPASLIYGSDAMAGVVILNDRPIMPEGKMMGNFFSQYQSNQGLYNYSLNFAGNKKGLVWDARYSDKGAHCYKNSRDGYVLGTGFMERALSGMFGLNKSWGYSHLIGSYYHLRPNMTEGERNDDGQFVKSIFKDGKTSESVATNKDFKSYSYALPYQQVYHSKIVSENFFILPVGTINFNLGWQKNIRKEYEEVETPNVPGLNLSLQTVNYDVRYTTLDYNGFKGNVGLSGMWQNNKNKGEEFLIPDYKLFDMGLYVTGSYDLGNLTLNAGLRYDHRKLHGYALEEDGEERFADFKRNFAGWSAGIGAVYRVKHNFLIRANIARGFRAPNIGELSSNGTHEGTQRYEVGNRFLKSEQSWQLDLGTEYSSKWFSAQINLFSNRINNYIFAQQELDNKGNVLLHDDTPVFKYRSGKAHLWGGEINMDIHPIERLHIGNAFSYVCARQLHQPPLSRYLPFIPAPRWNYDVRYDLIRDGKTWTNTFISFSGETNFAQNHYLKLAETETRTPSYTVFNFSAGTDLKVKGKTRATIIFDVLNLFDRAYQNHLSRLKYIGINPKTGQRGMYAPGRSFNIKLILPFDF